MHSIRTCTLLAALLAPALLPGQSVPAVTGSVSWIGGGSLQSGDRARYQRDLDTNKKYFGGVDAFDLKLDTGKNSAFTLNGHAIAGNEDYLVDARWANPETAHLSFGFKSYRIWSDGSGGYLPATQLALDIFKDDLHLDRGLVWFEVGTTVADKPQFKLRYELQTRKGKKDATMWSDTNLAGTVIGARYLVPAFHNLNEKRHIVTADLSQATEKLQWAVGARYDGTELSNSRNVRRRPFESVDRFHVTHDGTTTDLYAANGYFEKKLTEQISLSMGGIVTKIDTNIEGSRIFGTSYSPTFNPTLPTRQQRDEGFPDLMGTTELRQWVANVNLVYRPAKDWQITPSLRIENMRSDAESVYEISNVGAGPAFVTALEEEEGKTNRNWLEVTESLEGRYTGVKDWTHTARAEFVQGNGALGEDLLLEGRPSIFRESDHHRRVQKYSLTSNWYVQPGLSFGGQIYHKVRANKYRPSIDSTSNSSLNTNGDRYPSYIANQDLETNDLNLRMTWRPNSGLTLVSRYDYTQNKIHSQMFALGMIDTMDQKAHVLSQNVMWTPKPSLWINANVNVNFDQLTTPTTGVYVKNGDNNYLNGSLSAGYALAKDQDLSLDYSYLKADNFSDNGAFTTPYGANERQHVASATWVFRQTETTVYTLKYTYAKYTDSATGGMDNYKGQMIYGKVEYRF